MSKVTLKENKNIIYAFNPKMKLLALIFFVSFVFFPLGYTGIIFSFTLIFIAFIISRVKIRYLSFSIVPTLVIAFFVFLFTWFSNQNNILYATYLFTYITLRAFVVIFASVLFIATTNTIDISFAIAWLLKPLSIMGIKSDKIAVIVISALSYIPVMGREARKIEKSLKRNNIKFKLFSPKSWTTILEGFFLPFTILIVSKMDQLTIMSTVNFGGSKHFVNYYEKKFTMTDFILLSIVLLLFTLGVVMLSLNLDLIPRLNSWAVA